MTDEKDVTNEELDLLKARADKMGIKYHPNIGAETLRNKISDQLNGEQESDEETQVTTKKKSARKRTGDLSRKEVIDKATKLVRVRVTCMDPNKKGYEGEIFTVSNAVIGTVKKFVPFSSEEGWHIPQIILNTIKNRKCQIFQSIKTRDGLRKTVNKVINAYNVEVLPPLSKQELEELGRKQALGHHID